MWIADRLRANRRHPATTDDEFIALRGFRLEGGLVRIADRGRACTSATCLCECSTWNVIAIVY